MDTIDFLSILVVVEVIDDFSEGGDHCWFLMRIL
jgi:hypothetical protein